MKTVIGLEGLENCVIDVFGPFEIDHTPIPTVGVLEVSVALPLKHII